MVARMSSADLVQRKGRGSGVDGVDVVPDGLLEFLGRAMNPAPELFLGQECEEALDLVEPGGAGGREVDMPAGMPGQPTPDGGRLVGCVVVHHQMDVEFAGDLGFERAQENLRNSRLRWRGKHWPMTRPVAMSSAANSVVVPWRV